MATMGRYCKAYLLKDLRAFSGWSERAENAKPEVEPVHSAADENDLQTQPRILTDESIVYLQENHTVTDDIYTDTYILFDNVTTDWKDFCTTSLMFKIPEDVLRMTQDEADVQTEQ